MIYLKLLQLQFGQENNKVNYKYYYSTQKNDINDKCYYVHISISLSFHGKFLNHKHRK